MKLQRAQRVPVLIGCSVIATICLLRWVQPDFFERLELMTYDIRLRHSAEQPEAAYPKLGFVSIDERSIARVRDGSLGYRFGLYWPRQVYGRVVEELAAQGAKAVAFDVIFGELRPDHPPVQMADGSLMESDLFFASQMQRAGNVILAATRDLSAPPLFQTNAWGLGDISTDKDPDGILRRARAFRLYRQWHPAFRQVEADPEYGVSLGNARIESRQVVLPRTMGESIRIPLDADGTFDVADFWGANLPAGMPRRARPFEEKRIWHMGIVLAARELGLDLAHAEVNLARGRITLRGAADVVRVIPVDQEGAFYINWCVPPNHPALKQQAFESLLVQDRERLGGKTNELKNVWRDKLVVIGSSALANDLTDRGTTPLSADTLLVSKHWNVANEVLTGQFVRRAPLPIELGLILLLGVVSAMVTWEMRAFIGSLAVTLLAISYVAVGMVTFAQTRYWLPLVLPVLGALATTHLCLLAWRVVVEQAERRRVRSVFSKMVSPKIVNELLAAETLSLGGARREVSIFFADVRGFTALTDTMQERVQQLLKERQLSGAAAEAYIDEQAREALRTVNTYLGLIADVIQRHDGTLDKFIGDCVMAFWGAPTPNPAHAAACVRAAQEAQRVVYNENRLRLEANRQRLQAIDGKTQGAPESLQPILFLGSGINTGFATAGLMGSVAGHSLSYTVFGREVNLASRLESASGRGRIYISSTTYQHLLRDDPALAATCIELPPQLLKGFASAVHMYEVPWRPVGAPPLEQEFAECFAPASPETGFIRRTS